MNIIIKKRLFLKEFNILFKKSFFYLIIAYGLPFLLLLWEYIFGVKGFLASLFNIVFFILLLPLGILELLPFDLHFVDSIYKFNPALSLILFNVFFIIFISFILSAIVSIFKSIFKDRNGEEENGDKS